MHFGKSFKKLMTSALVSAMCLTTVLGSGSVWADDAAASSSVAEETDNVAAATSQMSDSIETDSLNRFGYDVVYVIDNSSSVWDRQAIRDQAFKNITNLAVGADIQIGGIYFSGDPYSTIAFQSMENKSESAEILDFLNMHSRNPKENYKGINAQNMGNTYTNIGKGFQYAKSLFEESDPNRKRIIVLFSDGVNEVKAGEPDPNVLTKEMTETLKAMGVDIYCVYLDMGSAEKEVQNEGYLKQVVNYFSEDENHIDERYAKVKASNINDLCSTFVDVFYKMQGNMKYRQISLDSAGKDKFYVPSFGISKVRIYLQGDDLDGTVIDAPANATEVDRWGDGNALFIDYKNEGSGWWNINVSSSDLSNVRGTITYYPSLSAKAEIERGADKQGTVKIHFSDENGKEVAIDDTAKIEASLAFKAANGSEKTDALEMSIVDGCAVSKTIDFSAYGDYSCDVRVTYDSYIDLPYSFDNVLEVGMNPPKITDITNGSFKAERVDGVLQFAIEESDLWTDPEGEAVEITGVTQINTANPVKYDQKDGFVYLTVQNASNVEFKLDLKDISEMTAAVKVQGSVSDETLKRKIRMGVIIGIIAVVAILLAAVIRRSRKKALLEQLFGSFKLANAEFDTVAAACDKIDFNEWKESLEEAFHGDDEGTEGLIEMSSGLTDELCKMYEMEEYLAEDYIDETLSKGMQASKKITDMKERMDVLKFQRDAADDNRKDLKAAIKSMTDYSAQANKLKEDIQKEYDILKAENDILEEKWEKIGNAGYEVSTMLDTPITCNLTIKGISSVSGARGTMSATQFGGKNRRGFYELEDIQLLGGRKNASTVRQALGHLGIYVFGYSDEEHGEEGLKLKGYKPFMADGRKVSEKVLVKGNMYEITVNSPVDGGRVSLILSV